MAFDTSFRYVDRESKAEYVWRKYRPILSANVLDVGADRCHLRPLVTSGGGTYEGIGYGPAVDRELNLEAGQLPYGDRSFDTVICLDTLEHLEAAHAVFDELCRIAKTHVLISLPNCWSGVWHALRIGDYAAEQPLKFYGLPEEPPDDRHRWFFSLPEARRFLAHNSARNGYDISQLDVADQQPLFGPGMRGLVKRVIFRRIFRPDMERLELTSGSLWCLLERTVEPS
jgi:SAM-dependent methyltransferase